MNTGDDRFDDAIRARHAASLEHLSPRVRAQLQQRRRAALAGQGPRTTQAWRFAFPLAAACAVGAIAFGLTLRTPDAPAPRVATTPATPSTTALRIAAATASTADDANAVAALEEDPALYVWMASDDAALMAME